MKFAIALLFVAIAMGSISAKSSYNKKLDKIWDLYKAVLDLAYDSAEEDAIRKAIFAQTDAMIQEHNSDPESTYQMAHSKFSAMTNEEKKASMFGHTVASREEDQPARAPRPKPVPVRRPIWPWEVPKPAPKPSPKPEWQPLKTPPLYTYVWH